MTKNRRDTVLSSSYHLSSTYLLSLYVFSYNFHFNMNWERLLIPITIFVVLLVFFCDYSTARHTSKYEEFHNELEQFQKFEKQGAFEDKLDPVQEAEKSEEIFLVYPLNIGRPVFISSCSSSCSKLKRYVCGSDGVTYFNPCHFSCAKKSNPNLVIVHEGAC